WHAFLGRISCGWPEYQCASCGFLSIAAVAFRPRGTFAPRAASERAASLRFVFFVATRRSRPLTAGLDGGVSERDRLQLAVPEESIVLGGFALMNAAASGVWQRNPALAWREIENETVIISPGESVMHELNDTGSLVWRNIDGHRGAEELAALLVK